MITINLQQARQLAEELKRQSAVKPKILITVLPAGSQPHPPRNAGQAGPLREEREKYHHPSSLREERGQIQSQPTRKAALLSECWNNFNEIKIERAKLSNTIYDLVESGADAKQMQELYQKIESFRPALQEAFKIARHVDQYGELPALAAATDSKPTSTDIYSLKDQKRKLVDKKNKLKTKIKKGKDPEQIANWEIDLDYAIIEYDQVDEQIKKLEGKL